MTPQDQKALDKSLDDAQKIARRLSRSITTIKAHRAALALIQRLKLSGARNR